MIDRKIGDKPIVFEFSLGASPNPMSLFSLLVFMSFVFSRNKSNLKANLNLSITIVLSYFLTSLYCYSVEDHRVNLIPQTMTLDSISWCSSVVSCRKHSFTPPGNYGNTLETTGQPSASVSPRTRRKKMLDVPDSGDIFSTSPLSSPPNSPSSPLLPRDPLDGALTPKSTTTPERPLIVEGNRFSRINVCHDTAAMKVNLHI